jgi:hypothetical protein
MSDGAKPRGCGVAVVVVDMDDVVTGAIKQA